MVEIEKHMQHKKKSSLMKSRTDAKFPRNITGSKVMEAILYGTLWKPICQACNFLIILGGNL